MWIDGLEEHRLAFHKAMIPLVRQVQRVVRGCQERKRHDMRVAKLERARRLPFYGAVIFLVAGVLLMLRRHPAVQSQMVRTASMNKPHFNHECLTSGTIGPNT